MTEDMRQAIAWERFKERAAERQARIEARRSHSGESADRVKQNADREEMTGRPVKDTKAPGYRSDR